MTAQHAWRQGKVAGAQRRRLPRPRRTQRPTATSDLGFVVDLGGVKAAANPLGIPLSGPLAGAVTRGYHLAAMPGNRVRVAADWLLDAVLPRQGVQLGLVRSWSVPLDTASPELARVPGASARPPSTPPPQPEAVPAHAQKPHSSEEIMNSRQLTELDSSCGWTASAPLDAAGSGHPTSSMSAADLMAVLLANHLRYDFDRPDHPGNDRFVLSKGHASPLLYAAYKAAGVIDDDELLTFRAAGQPARRASDTPAAAVGGDGHRLARPGPARRRRHRAGRQAARPYRLPGVGAVRATARLAEGSVWEAVEHASYEHLDNLTADRRRQPARAARTHPPRARSGRLRPPLRGLRLAHRSRSTATTSTPSTAPTARPSPPTGQPTVDPRPHPQGQGRRRRRGP